MSDGRYQSRILSFVARQTQKLADKASPVLRRIKVTTIWSTQIVLYPIYVLFQTTRLIGRQLRQAGQKLQARLAIGQPAPLSNPELPAVDAPIQQVLTAIVQAGVLSQLSLAQEREELAGIGDESAAIVARSAAILDASTERRDQSTSLRSWTGARLQLPLPALQGVACLIASRHLVLVTANNQLLDILTPEQQQRLQRQIILAIASYWYAWRRRTIGPQLPPLSPPRDRNTALPPVRILGQLMAWIQTGPIAITANLFQEAADEPAALDWFNPELPPAPPALLAWSWPQPARDWHSLTPPRPDPDELPDLIRAAIRYFFGQRQPGLTPARLAQKEHLPAVPFLRPATLLPTEDPGLTQADLGSVAQRSRPSTAPPPALPPPSQWGHLCRRWPWRQRPQQSRPAQLHSGQLTSAPPPLTVEPISPSKQAPIAAVPPTLVLVASTLSQRQSDQASPRLAELSKLEPRAQPIAPLIADAEPQHEDWHEDWIDAQFTPVGYVRHPLTQLLKWVDLTLLWLEARLIALWHGLGRLLR